MKSPDGDLTHSPLVQSIIDELRANDNVLALFLFGSVARGQARPLSDVDLCIVTRAGVPEAEKMELLSFGSDTIDLSLFEELPITIQFRVIKEGKILFSKDTS